MRYPSLLVRSREGAELHTERGKLIDYSSSDLFGIASHPRVRAAAHSAIERFGVDAVSSSERGGFTDIHEKAEHLIAEKLVGERALLFPTRAQAVISLLSAGMRGIKSGPVLVDKSVSSPAVDACFLGEIATFGIDLDAAQYGAPVSDASLLIVEAVSKWGFHVPNISKILEKYLIPIVADESFSFGIMGLAGFGNFPPPVLSGIPLVRIISFESSLGVGCCALVGSRLLVEELRFNSAQRRLDVGLAPSTVAAMVTGIEVLDEMSSRRDELAIKCADVIASLMEQGVTLGSTLPYPFISVVFPSHAIASEFCAGMLLRGMLVDYLGCLTPFSPACSVRIIITSAHNQIHLDNLSKSITELWRRLVPKS